MRRAALIVAAALAILFRARPGSAACPTCPNASFGPAVSDYSVVENPSTLAAADFDGDGRLDIVTNGLLLRGLPGGRFAPAVKVAEFTTGSQTLAVDLDGDGRPDLVGPGAYELGNGDGTFSPPVSFLTGASINSVAVGDFNNDGLPDLAVTTTEGLSILLNTGAGQFGPPITLNLGNTASTLVLGDFNGDGKLDVVLANQLFLGNGDGTFANNPLLLPFGVDPIAADFNRDGNLDLAYVGVGSTVFILYGHGDGTFDPPAALGVVYQQIQAGDFNGDGWPDIVAIGFPNQIVLFLSDGAGGFQPPLMYSSGSSPSTVIAGDFDGDGRSDVAVLNFFSGTLSVFLSNPDGSLRHELQLPAVAQAVASADLDGDGKKDLVTGGTGLAVWIGDGNGGFSAGYVNAAPTNVVAVAIADVNHDGHLDIVAVAQGPSTFPNDGKVWVFLGDGVGGFTSLPFILLDYAPLDARMGLLNADGFPDLLISGPGVHVLIGNGDGTFTAGAILGSEFGRLLVTDLSNDGKLDVAVTTAGGLSVYLGNGDGTFQAASDYVLGTSPFTMVAGDFNGDGKIDIVAVNTDLSFLRGRGDGTFEPSFTFPGPVFGASQIAALDFNGDGTLDIALTGSDAILMTGNGDGSFTESARYATGGAAGPVIVDDWNGDGKPDLAVVGGAGVSVLLNTNCVVRQLVLDTPPAICAVPGAPFPIQPVVSTRDDGGNVVACSSGSVSASLVTGTGSVGAVLGGATNRTLSLGVAAFSNLSIDLNGVDYALDFSHPSTRTVRIRPVSVHSPYSISIAGPTFICPANSTSFSADAGFDAYLWTVDGAKAGAGRTILLDGLSVGPHTLLVLATRAGCSATASLPIEFGVVPPSASNSGPVCAGEALQLTASSGPGGTYAWTGPNGFTSAAQNPMIPAATLAASGLYSVTVTLNGCASAPATTFVTVTPHPFVPVAHSTGVLCSGETLQLMASTVPGAVYAWTGPNGFTSSLQNPTIPSAIAADSGVYSVTVTVNGCTSPGATISVSVTACQERPVALSSDSAGNGVLEPGETAILAPSWLNTTGSSVLLTGAANAFTGPAGATYTIPDATASYGTVAAGATASCISTGDCYSVGVSNPAARPVLHWDGAFSEALSTGDTKIWSVHIGKSFPDVPSNSPFYRFVETLLHNGVTTGCGGGAYCPASSVTRAQMSVFLLVSQAGSSFTPPAPTGVFADVPVSSPFARWIEELARRGVTAGCGNGNFCPDAGVTRAQMAVFLLVTREGAAYVPPAPTGVFPDVPAGNPFAPWIEELFHRGIAAGCGNGNYCPFDPVSRAQMAVFLTATFGLSL